MWITSKPSGAASTCADAEGSPLSMTELGMPADLISFNTLGTSCLRGSSISNQAMASLSEQRSMCCLPIDSPLVGGRGVSESSWLANSTLPIRYSVPSIRPSTPWLGWFIIFSAVNWKVSLLQFLNADPIGCSECFSRHMAMARHWVLS